MANVTGPGGCEACGQPIPPQHGRGRRRRFCGATCRSAARRARDRSRRGPVPHPSPAAGRRSAGAGPRGDAPGGADPLAAALQRAAARLAAELADPAALPLEAVAAARELSGVTDAALRAAVDRARAAGQSWGRIGEVLGTTRQAAFQRFGHPDPHRG